MITAQQSVLELCLVLAAILCPIGMVQGWIERPKKIADTAERGRPFKKKSESRTAKGTAKAHVSAKKTKKKNRTKPPELSAWESAILASYFHGRDYKQTAHE